VDGARARLRAAGIPREEAGLDARLLAEFALGWDPAQYLVGSNQAAPPLFAETYEALIARRALREPIAYLTGRREFWGLELEVSPAVLIPRPETELVVQKALERFPDRNRALEIADVGAGSGCLAVTLAVERPAARVVAIDISADALAVAQKNADRHGVSDRIEFVVGNLLSATDRQFDLIVSNPPYVPEIDRPTLQPEVRDHEPAVALFAAESGLAVIRRLVEQSAAHLRPGGVLIFELGAGQADAVRQLIARARGLQLTDIAADLQGIPRVAMVGAEEVDS
jgi:release factor glutamine methyltransferase